MAQTVAVVFGVAGGMSDCGKMAFVNALKRSQVTVRPLALYAGGTKDAEHADTSKPIPADIRHEESLQQFNQAQAEVSIPRLDVLDDATQQAIENLVDGADGVVACLASRQPGWPRWLEKGACRIIEAMKAKGTSRLVILSSMGIGDDFHPTGCLFRYFWFGFMNLFLRTTKRDLYAMEKVVRESGLDYLIVKAMGLGPEAVPRSSYFLLAQKGAGRLEINISKADVGLACVDEALNPTLHRAEATVGHKKPVRRGRRAEGQAEGQAEA